MNTVMFSKAIENIRESSLLFVKTDLALIAGVSALDYFRDIDNAEAISVLNKFSFIIGSLLVLIAIGAAIEFWSTIVKNKISLGSNDGKPKKLKFELKLANWIYGVQVFGHIGLLGVLHGYLLAIIE